MDPMQGRQTSHLGAAGFSVIIVCTLLLLSADFLFYFES